MVIVIRYFYSRDPRLNAESKAYTQFLRTGFPLPTGIDIESMRERAEALHKKINEKLIGNFQGQEIEKKVEIKGKTGRFQSRFFQNKINNLEIPITIYKPIDVNEDKIVVFFHGGGKNKSLVVFKKF